MKKKKKQKPNFITHRGYTSVREKVDSLPKAYMSCMNCVFYYQAEGDIEECCQNSSVLEYDMVVEENRVYCLKWIPSYQGGKIREL